MLTCPSSRPVSGAPYHGYTGARSSSHRGGVLRDLPSFQSPRRLARRRRVPHGAGGGRGAAAGGLRGLRAHLLLPRTGHVGRHVRRARLERPGRGGQGHGRRTACAPSTWRRPTTTSPPARRPCSGRPTPAGSSRRRTRAASRSWPGTCRASRTPPRTGSAPRRRSTSGPPDGQKFDSFTLDIEASIVKDVDTRNARLHTLSDRIRAYVGRAVPAGRRAPRRRRAWPTTPPTGRGSPSRCWPASTTSSCPWATTRTTATATPTPTPTRATTSASSARRPARPPCPST